jgi:hypothetical protein
MVSPSWISSKVRLVKESIGAAQSSVQPSMLTLHRSNAAARSRYSHDMHAPQAPARDRR